jgi:hypothetical protein
LIIDGAAITGDTIEKVTNFLIENNFVKNNIYWASLFVTKVALEAGKSPNIYWIQIPDSDIYLPWGKLLGRGYS